MYKHRGGERVVEVTFPEDLTIEETKKLLFELLKLHNYKIVRYSTPDYQNIDLEPMSASEMQWVSGDTAPPATPAAASMGSDTAADPWSRTHTRWPRVRPHGEKK